VKSATDKRSNPVKKKYEDNWRKNMTTQGKVPLSAKQKTHGVTESTSRTAGKADSLEQAKVDQRFGPRVGQRHG